MSARGVRYFASSWSPPAWLKTNNKINNGGFVKGKPGGKFYEILAKYYVKFLDAYAQHNVSIWGLTVQNEPEAGFLDSFKWNSLALNQSLERDFIRLDLGPELHRAGYTKDKLKLMIHDSQLPLLKSFVEQILASNETAKYVSGIAFHWYWNEFANFNDLTEISQKYPDYFLLASEACEELADVSDHVLLGNWTVFDRYVVDIIKVN